MPKITSPDQLPGVRSLRRFANRGNEFRFLEFFAFQDVAFHIDDFDQDTINLDRYAVANSGGTSVGDFAIDITAGATAVGAITSDSGTTDNGSTSLIGPIIYKGDNHAGMWCRFKVDDVTNWEMEIGFVDAVPAANGPAFSAVAPTATAANAAVIHLDTDEATAALDALHFLTVGSTANQSAKATSLIGATPTNATWMDVVIQLIGDDAYCTVSSASNTVATAYAAHNVRTGNNAAGFNEGGTALAPWIYNRTRNTTAKFMSIDALAVWSYRTAQ